MLREVKIRLETQAGLDQSMRSSVLLSQLSEIRKELGDASDIWNLPPHDAPERLLRIDALLGQAEAGLVEPDTMMSQEETEAVASSSGTGGEKRADQIPQAQEAVASPLDSAAEPEAESTRGNADSAMRLAAAGGLLDRLLGSTSGANQDEMGLLEALRSHLGQLEARSATCSVAGEVEELREELIDVADLWQGEQDAAVIEEAIKLLVLQEQR